MNGKNEAVAIMSRIPENEFLAIENWRRAQPKIPTLSSAVRQLVKRAIEAADSAKLGAKLDRAARSG